MKTFAALTTVALLAAPAAAKVKKPLPTPVDEQVVQPAASFNPDEAARNIRSRMSIVRACFERANRREPGIEGKLQLGFQIGDHGQVAATQVEVDGLRAPVDHSAATGLATCIRQQALNWKLTANDLPAGGAHVSYVFVFEASN